MTSDYQGHQFHDGDVIGVLVNCAAPEEAESIADVRMAWEILPAYQRGASFRRTRNAPRLVLGRTEADEGYKALYRLWHAQQREYQGMLELVADAL